MSVDGFCPVLESLANHSLQSTGRVGIRQPSPSTRSESGTDDSSMTHGGEPMCHWQRRKGGEYCIFLRIIATEPSGHRRSFLLGVGVRKYICSISLKGPCHLEGRGGCHKRIQKLLPCAYLLCIPSRFPS